MCYQVTKRTDLLLHLRHPHSDFLLAEPLQVVGPLLHERDLYLAWSCKRSKAVCGARAVVGVIGRSHMFGTAYHLLQVREILDI